MDIKDLQTRYAAHPQIGAVAALVKRGDARDVLLAGLHGSSRAMCIAALSGRIGGCLLCLMNDIEEAGYFYNDLVQLVGEGRVSFFPSAYQRDIKYGHTDAANEVLRTETLAALQADSPERIIVSYPDAVAERVPARSALQKSTLSLHTGEGVDPLFVSDVLDTYGFTQTDYVYEPGQYAVRGSIMDIFSFSNERPYRVDFFGSEVESIRTFDVETQLSQDKLTAICIIPEISRYGHADSSLLELLPQGTAVVMSDAAWCRQRIAALWDEEPVNKDDEGFTDREAMRRKLIQAEDFARALKPLMRLHFQARAEDAAAIVRFDTAPQPLFQKNFNLVSQSFRQYLREGYTLYLLTDSEKQAERIRDIFKDRGDDIAFTPVNRTLHEGFTDRTLRCCCFTDHQIFGRFHKYNLRSDRARSGKMALTLKELNQFTPGDFIVHIDHGVGRFGGLVRTEVNGHLQEAVKLIYRNNDILFVSIHALHKLSKYKGKDGEAPALNKLGSGTWEKLKDRTKKKVKDIARDLIRLYATRRQQKGFAFSPDSFMQDELEASFIYEDTPDQMRATAEVKADMERERPMDRLVCGDVGFGKTEVAMRAAFKAVTDNKQVAVLVPTTVLAFQHYRTFCKRLKDFPCTIDYISRARSTSEIKAILRRLASGELNILIGTHRIVGRDVRFKDLGLLIIDEEQKFGVSVKEKLRQLRTNVDTLTLTATPIPRTLQFSLMGARDLSNITTPPPNRYPVQTEIQRFNADIIREAISFEMSRNGQVFVINNRIQNIYEIEALIRREVPDARVAVGHGRMEPEALERVVIDFVNYEYDVLVATTILENGIDVSNANTIIVCDAHHFGLSELHQLRGRVGRSNRKAFCYLLAPPLTTLPPDARRRLQAIESFSELGSGMHIAMQDLDIRGAGNMLGAEQSGFIADLGYETYQKILEEAVDELKADEFADLYASDDTASETGDTYVRETFVESDLELMFPPTYIPNDSERVALYRELDSIETDDALKRFVSALQDRFGRIPTEGEELIRVVGLRRMARRLGIEKVVLKRSLMALYLPTATDSPYYQSRAFGRLLTYIGLHPRACQLREQNGRRSIVIRNVASVAAAVRCLTEVERTEPEAG